jgi:hypothetical protein
VRVRGGGDSGDGLSEKLVKYVPAETLAFFVPISAGLGSSRDGVLLLVIIVAAVGTVGYLWTNGRTLAMDKRPRSHFYLLAVIAFLAWALGTNANVADLVGMDTTVAGVVLGCAIFLIPLVDEVITTVRPRW